MTQLLIRLFVRHPDDTKNAAVRTAYGTVSYTHLTLPTIYSV